MCLVICAPSQLYRLTKLELAQEFCVFAYNTFSIFSGNLSNALIEDKGYRTNRRRNECIRQ